MSHEEKAFAQRRKEFRESADKKKIIIQLGGEFAHVVGATLNAKGTRIFATLAKVRSPQGWRANVWNELLKRSIIEANPESLKNRREAFRFGKSIGIFVPLAYAMRKILKVPNVASLFPELFAFFKDGPDVSGLIGKFVPLVSHLHPGQIGDFCEGMAAGVRMKRLFSRSTAEVYLFLLLLGELVEVAPSAYELHALAKRVIGRSFQMKPTSFETLCRRRGIPLALKSRSKPRHSKIAVSGVQRVAVN